jgi:hypothetical protein
VELRQVLELRSLIQDDALGLAPPEDLTEHTRLLVAERFASERVIHRDDEDRRRRAAGIFPFRIAAGVMATTFVVLMVAIGPSMIERFGNRSTESTPAIAELMGGGPAAKRAVPQSSATTSESGVAVSPATASRNEARSSASTSRSSRRQNGGTERPGTSAGVNEVTIVADDRSGEPRVDAASTPQSLVFRDEHALSSPEDRALLERLNVQSHPALPYQPLVGDRLSNADEAKALAAATEIQPVPALPGESSRRLMIGVMLGSGRVTETTAPTPVIQNSYYFAFSLTANDRIGLEMGSSAFQQARSIATFTTVTPNGLAKGGADGQGDGAQLASAGAGGSGDTQNGLPSQKRMTLVEQRAEQQITYGTVFYDRRMKLSENWDICGRLGLGAADNALVGHARAYGAFSPSKNVTLTLGVGGSGLQPLSGRSPEGSGNYGIYYGIETGF